MELAPGALYLLIGIESAVLAGWFGFLYLGRFSAVRGVSSWFAAMALQSLGWLIIGLTGTLPPEARVPFPGLLLMPPAAYFMLRGFRRLLDAPGGGLGASVILFVGMAGLLLFSYLYSSQAARVVCASGAVMLLSGAIIRTLRQSRNHVSSQIRNAVLWVFGFLIITLLIRFVEGLRHVGTPGHTGYEATQINILLALPFSLNTILPSLVFFSTCLEVTEQQSRRNEHRVTEVIDSVDGIVWEANATTFDFTFVSQRAEHMLGYKTSEWLLPGFWAAHIYAEDRETAVEFCVDQTRAMQSHEFEYRFVARDGRIVWLRDTVTVITIDGQPRWLRGVMTDISAHKSDEAELKKARFMFELLSTARKRIAQATTETDLWQAVVETCTESSEIRLAWVGLPADDYPEINLIAAAGSAMDYLSGLHISTDAALREGQGPTGIATRIRHDVIVNYPGAAEHDYWTERRRQVGLNSYAAVAIRLPGLKTGTLNLYAAQRGFFQESLMRVFDQMAADIAEALDRIDAERWRAFAEGALRENQLLLDFALESTVDAVWDFDAESGTVRFFRHWEEMLGFAPGTLPNDLAAWEARVHPDDLQAANTLLGDYMAGRIGTYDTRVRVKNRDGNYIWIKYRGLIVERRRDGFARRLIGTLKNIDVEIRRAEEARHNAELLNEIFHSAPVGITLLNRERRLIRANRAVHEMTGIADDSTLQHILAAAKFHYPEGGKYPEGAVPDALRLGNFEEPYASVFGFQKDDQTPVKWISMLCRHLPEVDLVMRFSTDITHVIEAEKALRASEEKFRALFQALPVSVSIHNIDDRRVIDGNPKLEEFARFSIDEIKAGKHRERAYFDTSGRPVSFEQFPTVRALRENTIVEDAILGFREDGIDHWFAMTIVPMRELGIFAAITRDITDERQQLGKIEQSELKFRLLFENAPVGVILFDERGVPKQWNQTAREQSKLASWNEAYDRQYYDSAGKMLSAEDLPLLRALRLRQPVKDVIFGDRVEGTVRWFKADVVPIESLALTLVMTVDITRLVEAQKELEESARTLEDKVLQRTEALSNINAELESFSYSLSHDLKAPLTRAESWLNILQHELRGQLGEKGNGYLAYVRTEIQSMVRMNEAMLALSRSSQGNLNLHETNLSEIVLEVLDQLRAEDTSLVLDVRVSPDIILPADADLMRILLRNLLENAVKFSREQEKIEISFGAHAGAQFADCFVRDNGVGFDMQYADRLFAPFQRLHAQSQYPGTGIGLATAQRIVHRHQGKIWAESSPGAGTTIFFRLPLHQGGE